MSAEFSLVHAGPNARAFGPVAYTGLLRDITCGMVTGMFAAFTAVLYAELMYQHTKRMYKQGKLLRYAPLPEDRDWSQGFLVVCSFACPCTLLYYVFLKPVAISFHCDPVEVTLGTLIYMVCHDAYFYWAHRYMHINKRIYKALHLMHHEYTTTTNNFVVGWADCLENFIQVGLPWMVWTFIAHRNFWNLVLPFFLTLFTTLIGHSGFKTNRSFALYNPLIIPIQYLMGRQMLTAHDHGGHHIYRTVNYGLFFRFWDKYYSTYRRNELKAHPYSYWCELAQQGKLTATCKVRYNSLGTTKERQELKLVELGQTSWGF